MALPSIIIAATAKDIRLKSIMLLALVIYIRLFHFMRFIGLKWLASRIYPKEYKLDINQETKSFYTGFLGVELGDRDLLEILAQ